MDLSAISLTLLLASLMVASTPILLAAIGELVAEGKKVGILTKESSGSQTQFFREFLEKTGKRTDGERGAKMGRAPGFEPPPSKS